MCAYEFVDLGKSKMNIKILICRVNYNFSQISKFNRDKLIDLKEFEMFQQND